MPPPYLEIHWRKSVNGSFDEMDMDDMFDRNLDDEEEDCDDVDDDDDEGIWSEENRNNNASTVWRLNQQQMAQNKSNINNNRIKRTSADANMEDLNDAKDGLDIQSISSVKGELWYHKNDNNSDEKMTTENDQQPNKKTVSLENFEIMKVIGKGSFGKVFLVRDKAAGSLHALKVLKKDYIISKNQVEHTKTERSVLGYIHHPYIVGLTMAFQTADKLFFVLDYCAGGELFFHLGKVGRFPEDRAKFYAAQITLALEYVHSLDIVYRDLKPENVLLDSAGNIRLTDFGLSKEGVSDHSTGASSFCGTPEYIAPEVLARLGHGRAVDWWSLGALLYEMICGLPPFYSRNRETMFEKIMKADLTFPPFMSENAKSILSRLLVRDPKMRLGSCERDADELKEHPFFSDIDWVGLLAGRIPSPWTPHVSGSLDTSQFDQEFTSMLPIVSPDVRGAYFGSLDRKFEGFTYVDDSNIMTQMAQLQQMNTLSSSFRSGSSTLMATRR